MKKIWIVFAVIGFAGISLNAMAEKHDGMKGGGMHMQKMKHSGMHELKDDRISLGLGPQMKQRQLAMMRSHLESVQTIVGLLAEDKFDEASDIAHNKLGLTRKMKKMCNMFTNDNFRSMGLAFHQNADELGDVLKTRNMKRSLDALQNTINSCVQCHATFRQ